MSKLNELKIQKIFTLFLCGILLTSLFPSQYAFSATISLPGTSPGDETRLGAGAPVSDKPAIFATGNNVTVAFEDGTDIRVINSTDNGATFPSTAKDIGDTAGTGISKTQVAIIDRNVNVMWRESTDAIKYATSIDNGINFGTPITIDGNSTTSRDFDMAVSDSGNVYAVWHDQQTSRDNVLFKRSINNGSSFETIQVIEDDAGFAITTADNASPDPQVATSGDFVYVVWQNSTDILVARSVDNGANFGTPVDVGDVPDANNFDRSLPQIAAADSNVYVTFRNESSTDLFFTRSTDNGDTFATATSIGDVGPVDAKVPSQIVVSGDNVYITWLRDLGANDDIIFLRSTDKGASFDSEINLSNDGSSKATDPRIAVSGANVYVVWEDFRFDSSNGDVVLKASTQGGVSGSFPTNPQQLSSTGATDVQDPVVGASGSKVYVAWRDPESGQNNIFFKAGTVSGADIEFDKAQYKTGDTATVTVTDTSKSGAGSIFIKINSTTTANPTNYTLPEFGGSTGIFKIDLTLSQTTTSSTELKISAGDTVKAFSGGNTGQASIFSRIISFGVSVNLDRGNVVNIKVTDPNSNQNSGTAETIDVTVKSDKDTTGITLTLTETGLDSGIFGGGSGATESSLVLFTDVGTATTSSEVTVNQTAAKDLGTITATITSTSDTSGTVQVDLVEDTVNLPADDTKRFYIGKFTTTTGSSSNDSDLIQVAVEDVITITTSPNGLVRLLLVTPVGAADGTLQVNTLAEGDDTLVATVVDTSASILVRAADSEGGGGGGLVRPGLVVNILASLGSAASGGGASAPIITLNDLLHSSFIDIPDEIKQVVINFDAFIPLEPYDVTAEQFETFDFPLSIDNDGFALSGITNTIDTKTLNVGEPVKIKTVFYMPVEVEHVAFYIDMREGDTISNSDAYLIFSKSGAEQFQMKDQNGLFEYINLTLEENGIKKTATFDIKFLKPMEKSDIVLRMWDAKLHSTTIIIFDAIEVVGPSISLEEPAPEDLEIPEPGTTQPETSELTIEEPTTAIPDWIKTSAGWWHSGEIDKDSFVQGIQFLIKEKIINIPDLPEQASTTSEEYIPDWIKNTAGWWSEGVITEGDFISGIKWLVENGIIKV